jgi:hypothetical protein
VNLDQGGVKNHEVLFLPILTGCSRCCFGDSLVAGCMGKMGDRCRGGNSGYHEHFLPDVLL